jgi:hypothetical protein
VKIIKLFYSNNTFLFCTKAFLRVSVTGRFNFFEWVCLKHHVKQKSILYLLHLGHLMGHAQELLAHEAAAFVKGPNTLCLFCHRLLFINTKCNIAMASNKRGILHILMHRSIVRNRHYITINPKHISMQIRSGDK